jgi:hypothetical protein
MYSCFAPEEQYVFMLCSGEQYVSCFAPEEQYVYSPASQRNMALRRSAILVSLKAINMSLLRSEALHVKP